MTSNISSGSASVHWSHPEYNGGTPITNYIIEQREASRMNWRRVGLIAPTENSFEIHNLLEGQEYFVRVSARNKEGESFPLISDIISTKHTTGDLEIPPRNVLCLLLIL